jgi:hypothetical protein
MLARIGIVAVLAIGACYAPSPAPGAPCGPDELCPAGLTCSNNLCVDRATTTDAADPDSPLPDDTSPELPRKRWSVLSTTGKVGTSVEIPATHAGTSIVVGVETAAAGFVDGVSDSGGNTYERVPQSRAVNIGKSAVEVWVASAVHADTVKISVDGSMVGAAVAWEVENLAAQDPIAAVETEDAQPSTTAPRGASIETSARGQFVVSILIVANFVDSIVAGDFTNDQTTFGNGWAHLTDDDAAPGVYQAQWSQPMTGTSCATSVAFRTAD